MKEMPMLNETWRIDIEDLRAYAHDVHTQTTPQAIHARSVAQCLSGVIGLASRRYSLSEVQASCALLARHARTWETSLGDLPRGADGRVSELVEMIAAVARGMYPLAGARGVRSALAFWACERDAAVWMSLALPELRVAA
jgi:hypothetical protein